MARHFNKQMKKYKNVALTFLLRLSSVILQSLQVVLLVRLFGSETYGVYAVCLGVFSFTMAVGRMGLDHYTLRECNARPHTAVNECVRLSYFVALPIVLASLLSFLVVFLFYPESVSDAYVFFLISSFFYSISWNQFFILRALDEINIALFLQTIFNPLMLISFGYAFRDNSQGLSFAFLCSSIVTSLLTFKVLVNKTSAFGPGRSRVRSIQESLKASRGFHFLTIFEALQSLADSLAVGLLLVPSQVTVYAIFTKLGTFIMLPATITMMYGNNIAARWSGKGMRQAISQLKTIRSLDLVLSGLVAIGVSVSLPLLEVLFDLKISRLEQYALWIVSAAFFFDSATNFARSAALMGGEESRLREILIGLMFPYLASLAFFGLNYGLIGIVISFAVFRISAKVLLLIYLYRLCDTEPV